MSKFKLAICQMKVVENKDENLKKAEKMIRQAHNNDADVIVLPEMFNCPYANKYFPEYAEVVPGPTTNFLSKLAKEFGVYIVGGSIPEKVDNKIYNTSFIFDRSGNIIGRHRKMHLFDIDVKGAITFKESDTLSSGNEVTVFETEFCKVGVAICYDMRFPELIRLMVLKGAEMIIVPAAFNMTTGPAHWHLTAKARALDNQVYFAAASPARNINSIYVAYGHSLIASPWGDIIAEANEKETILYGEIDLEKVKKVREELPLLKHRRISLYNISEDSIH
ncbi:MAG: omega-amidase [Candidatus Petromonas sp.]|nr:omega-amidase [Candidatus Petromonas sp.]